MIVVIRISGMVDLPSDHQEALYRLRLRRKYSAVLIEDTPLNRKLLMRVRNYVAYGKISQEMLAKLVAMRGEGLAGKKLDAEKVAGQIGKKSYEELGMKPFFRLHPPRKGIESKKHFGVGKGVLGDNGDKINDLLERML